MSSTKRMIKSPRGFTLIELLVVIAIMVIITGVLLIRQQQFDSSTLLRSLAYSVALSVSQAQVYGVSVEQATNGEFVPAYGIYMNASDQSHYYLFGDAAGNGQDDAGENQQTFTLGNGYTISNFCAYTQTSQDCSSGPGNTIKWLTIVFRRPNPEACFATDLNPGVCATGAAPVYTSGYIQLTSVGGSTRSVTVSSTGEISVGAVGS